MKISNKRKNIKIAIVTEALTIFLDSTASFPSMTATSNFAFTISITMNKMEVQIPNSAKSLGEKYFGKTKENKKLMICTAIKPVNNTEKFLNNEGLEDAVFILTKLQGKNS